MVLVAAVMLFAGLMVQIGATIATPDKGYVVIPSNRYCDDLNKGVK